MQRDSLGYLWVGTDRGVNIFDGTNYRQLLHDRLDTASLRSDNVLKIYRGRTHLWVLTDQGIDRYAGNGRFVHYRTNARSQRASCMIERKDGSVVALFGNELCALDGLTFKRMLTIPRGNVINEAIVDDSKGRLLVNTTRGLYLVDKELVRARLFLQGSQDVVCADSETVCRLSFTQGIVYIRRKDFSVLYRSGESMPVVANSAVIWHGTVYFSGHDGVYRIDPHSNAVTSLPADILADSYHPFIKTMYADPQGDLWIGYIMHGLKHLKSVVDWQRRLKADRALRLIRNKTVVGVVSGDQGDAWGALAHDSLFHFDGHTDSVVAIPLTGLLPIHSQQHIKGVAFSAGLFWVVTTSNVFALRFDEGFRLEEFYDVGLAQAALCGPFVPIPKGLAVLAGLDRLVVFDALHRGETIKEVRLAANGLPVVYQTGDLTVTTRRVAGVDFTSVSDAVGTNRNLFIKEGLNGWEAIDLKSGKVAHASFPLKANILSSTFQGSHLFLGTDAGLYVYDPSQSRLTAVRGFAGKAVNNVVVSQGTASTVLMTIGGTIVAYDFMEHRSHVVWEGIDRDDFLPSTLALLPGNRLLAANRKGLQLFQIPSHGERVRLPALHLEALDVLMPHDKVESVGLLQADSSSGASSCLVARSYI